VCSVISRRANRTAPRNVRRRLGFISRATTFLGALSASQNVQLGLRVTGSRRRVELGQGRCDAGAVGLGEHTTRRRNSSPVASDQRWPLRARWSVSRPWSGGRAHCIARQRPRVARWSSVCSHWRGSGAPPSDGQTQPHPRRCRSHPHLEDGKLATYRRRHRQYATDDAPAGPEHRQAAHRAGCRCDGETAFRGTLQEPYAAVAEVSRSDCTGERRGLPSMLEQSLRVFNAPCR